MNIVFTCGGTGGHIYPAIAVARMFRERQPDCRILFIGAEDGMENKLVPREGFELQTVQISNYQRKLTPAAIWHNLVTVQRMSATFAKTKRILKDFQPDVIVGTGGYASFPALKMGAKLGIPTCVHESNAVPGLTTKLVARTASRIMVSFDASRQHYPDPENSKLFPGREYLSCGHLDPLGFYPIPYRCFYSKDITNMFMAGRNISVSHVALGTVRVMRTTAMMGEVVGMAAAICRRRKALPRDVYGSYLEDLKSLMRKGVGRTDMPYLQVYTLIDTTAARSEDC